MLRVKQLGSLINADLLRQHNPKAQVEPRTFTLSYMSASFGLCAERHLNRLLSLLSWRRGAWQSRARSRHQAVNICCRSLARRPGARSHRWHSFIVTTSTLCLAILASEPCLLRRRRLEAT